MHETVDYRKLRWSNLNSERFRHVKLLFFWPVFGIIFYGLERLRPPISYHYMYCALDDLIPFSEYFVIPYLFWFVFMAGMLLYAFFYETDTFQRYMWYIIFTYSVTLVIFLFFPTAQRLRPHTFVRHNIFTNIVAGFYAYDTSTNVCPSIHVIGSFAVMFAAWSSRLFSRLAWKIVFGVMAVLISVSTVFLKQHSALDVLVAMVVCLAAWPFTFSRWSRRLILAPAKRAVCAVRAKRDS